MNHRAGLAGLLVLLGVGWGASQSLGKIAVSGGYSGFGVIFWQVAICTAVLGAITLVRGRGLRFTPAALRFYVVVAMVGTIIPNSTFYVSVAHLPAGIMSIIIATVPLIAFPMALALGEDVFTPRRLAGLSCGLAGVALIALPRASLPDVAMARYLPVALIGPFFYAVEGTIVARWGTAGMDAIQAMFGASLAAMLIALPLALATHAFVSPFHPWGSPDWAVLAMSSTHALIYAGYVWLAARAGSVFATQTSYFVTGSGVLWAMLLLGERFSPWVWAALALMLGGVALVRPRAGRGACQPVPVAEASAEMV